MARNLSILGTSSNAGKSLITAGLCRILAREGVRVAPFKGQNMALNAFVTADGGEIGYAQAFQARAAGLLPTRDMNPVLIKPEADMHSQLIVRGEVRGRYHSRDFRGKREELFEEVATSFDRLASEYEVILLEGAGSPVELNLMEGDLANLRMAAYADAEMLLVGDIHRGGIFAAMWGTVALMPPESRRRLKGLIVNKFRGDASLFADGATRLAELTGVPVAGVVPWTPLVLPEEDSAGLDDREEPSTSGAPVVVVRLPHISNFTDFDPLRAEPGIQLAFRRSPPRERPRAVIIPGSKTTLHDLNWLHVAGWSDVLRRWAAAGTVVLGICGGYQMLGCSVADPLGVEGPVGGQCSGVGLVPADSIMQPRKTTRQRVGRVVAAGWEPVAVKGYEIHAGITTPRVGQHRPWLRLEGPRAEDGWHSADGRVFGTYLHGLFDAPGFRREFLSKLGVSSGLLADPVEEALDVWEEVLRRHVDLATVFRLVGV
ncbi:MAG: cobyric acid synthase [Thermaerobacter sp.]|nr:cobyric acid synthase [Thermaerobacter sp.]